jgi:hypothetical protein
MLTLIDSFASVEIMKCSNSNYQTQFFEILKIFQQKLPIICDRYGIPDTVFKTANQTAADQVYNLIKSPM